MNPVSLRAIGVGKELAARGLDTEIAQESNGWLEQCAASISMVVDLSPTHAAIFDCKLRSDLKYVIWHQGGRYGEEAIYRREAETA